MPNTLTRPTHAEHHIAPSHPARHTMKRKPKHHAHVSIAALCVLASSIPEVFFFSFLYVPYVQVYAFTIPYRRESFHTNTREPCSERALNSNQTAPHLAGGVCPSPPTTTLGQALHDIGKPLQE